MKHDLRILNILSGKDAAVILVHGLDNEIYSSRIREYYKVSSDTFTKRIKELSELGLIIIPKRIGKGFKQKVVYPLTPKGKKIAEHLEAIYQILIEED